MSAPDDDTPGDETSDDALGRNDDAPHDAWAEADRAYALKWGDTEADQADSDLGALSAEPDPFSPGSTYTPTTPGHVDLYVSGQKRRVATSAPLGAHGYGMMSAGPYLGLGVQIAASMAVFAGGGYALDRWLGTTPWGILVGAMLGMVGIVALVVRVAREADRESARRRK